MMRKVRSKPYAMMFRLGGMDHICALKSRSEAEKFARNAAISLHTEAFVTYKWKPIVRFGKTGKGTLIDT